MSLLSVLKVPYDSEPTAWNQEVGEVCPSWGRHIYPTYVRTFCPAITLGGV